MTNDSITDEIRAIRRELAAQFGNDVSKILADARQREAADGRTYVTLSKRLPRRNDLDGFLKTIARRGPFNG
ncbi:MAG: hypothetical protein ACR2FY_21600 [Pirellulaceae bacterium]